MKNIVVVGGGSGIFNILKGLKNYPVNITSIVTTFDDGGSTGILRDEFGTIPSGDIRRSLVALSPDIGDSTIRDLFNFRFPKNSSLNGHSFGNLFIQALTSITGNEVSAIKKAATILNIQNKILPISIDNAQLCAKLENGNIIKGETNIDIPKHDGSIKIKDIYLEPNAIIYRESYEALINADIIIIGPGDLYTSIIPNILTEGFSEAIKSTKAKIIYISNIMTKWGETNDFKVSDFVKTLLSYIKIDKLDYIICNNSIIGQKLIEKYKEAKSEPVIIDKSEISKYSKNVIEADVALQTDIVRHDPMKITKIIMKL